MKRGILVFSIVLMMVLLPLSTAQTSANYGGKLLITDSEFIPTLETVPGQVRLVSRVDGTHTAYYAHFDAAGADTALAAGKSFRFTCGVSFSSSCPSTAKEGTWVEAGAPDLSPATFTSIGLLSASVHMLEADGVPGWTDGDGLYLDVDNSNTLNVGDIRLKIPTGTCTGCAVSQAVKSTDTDLTRALATDRAFPLTTTYDATAFDLHWFDANNDRGVSRSDVFYLKPSTAVSKSGNTLHPDLNDVRVTDLTQNPYASGITYLSTVLSSSPDYKPLYRQVSASVGVVGTDPDQSKNKIFVLLPGARPDANVVRIGDVVLYNGAATSSPTLVTSVATGHGSGATNVATLDSKLRIIDNAPTGNFGSEDVLYLKHPTNSGGTVEINDLRLRAFSSLAAGTMAKAADADLGQTLVAFPNPRVATLDVDDKQTQALQTMANIKISGGDAVFDKSTEGVYIQATGSNVVAGTIRLYHPTLTSGHATVVACPGGAGNDTDCNASLTTYSKVRVLGPDATYDPGNNEAIFDSEDAFLNPGDIHLLDGISAVAKGTTVAAGDAVLSAPVLTTSDRILVYSEATGAAGSVLPDLHSAFLFGQALGTSITTTTAGYVPKVTIPTTQPAMIRYNRGEAGSVADDQFYLSFGAGTTLKTGDIRLTGGPGSAAGTLIKTSDSGYSSEVAGGSQFSRDASAVGTRACIAEEGGVTGFGPLDRLYLQTAGLGQNADTTKVDIFDLRITQYPQTGTKQQDAGTLVLSGHQDTQAGLNTCTTLPAGVSATFGFVDINGNGALDTLGSTDEVGYMLIAPAAQAESGDPLPLHSVRLNGPGGAPGTTPPATPPAGGAPATQTTTTAATTTTAPATTTTQTQQPPVTSTTTQTVAPAIPSVAAEATQTILSSLEIKRVGSTNTLAWVPIEGAYAYQVWTSDSPWRLASYQFDPVFVDADAPADRLYYVNAVMGSESNQIGFISNLDAYNPSGVAVDSDEPGRKTPGLGVLAVIGLLGALVAVRRRE